MFAAAPVTALIAYVKREKLASGLLILLLGLCLIAPGQIPRIPGLINWRTITALGGLLCLTTALELSGGLRRAAGRLIEHAGTERRAALALVSLTIVAAMVVTNDVALFIAVPLTLNLSRLTGQSPVRLVIFEALAANTGSLLTPIGNPQNLFLWQTSGASFAAFTLAMAPLALALIAGLMLTTWLAFPPQALRRHEIEAVQVDRGLLAAALALYIPFLIAVNAGWAIPAGVGLLVLFLLFRCRVLARLDWTLLLVFVLMFVDLRLLAALPAVHAVLADMNEPHRLYSGAILLSQVISNVPAAIALEPFSHDWKILAYGVNIGGFGLLPGSLANLIALRLLGHKGAWRGFHLWSIPALILAAVVGYVLLFAH